MGPQPDPGPFLGLAKNATRISRAEPSGGDVVFLGCRRPPEPANGRFDHGQLFDTTRSRRVRIGAWVFRHKVLDAIEQVPNDIAAWIPEWAELPKAIDTT
jgi:hypothetical protein